MQAYKTIPAHAEAGRGEKRGHGAGDKKPAALQERKLGIGESRAVEGEDFEGVQICALSIQGV